MLPVSSASQDGIPPRAPCATRPAAQPALAPPAGPPTGCAGLHVPEAPGVSDPSCVCCIEGWTHRRAPSSEDTRLPAPEQKQTDSCLEGRSFRAQPRGPRRLAKCHQSTAARGP